MPHLPLRSLHGLNAAFSCKIGTRPVVNPWLTLFLLLDLPNHPQNFSAMSTNSRKRPRSVEDKDTADCPFTLNMVVAKASAQGSVVSKGKDKPASGQDEQMLVQEFPFKVSDEFGGSMDQAYVVEPSERWKKMTRYSNCICESPCSFRILLAPVRFRYANNLL